MFQLAILIGLYSYAIFGLGVVGVINKASLGLVSLLFLGVLLWILKPKVSLLRSLRLHPYSICLIVLGVINLIGALGPELSFDALWYHLTIPRIWLLEHRIFFLGNEYFYYSVMPKLIDLLYLPGLAFGNEILAKIIHWGFGLLTLGVTYQLARKWLDHKWSLLAGLVFYSNLVVGWQSTTAYIDLGRSFFEVLALYCLIDRQIYKSAVILGLGIATKLLAIGSLPVLLAILLVSKAGWKKGVLFTGLSLLIPLPWFIFALLSTGNPIHPIFSGYYPSFVRSVWDLVTIWLNSADPLSPLYIMTFPLVFIFRKKLPWQLLIYCLGTLGVWWLTPRTGGGRFIMPYLPAFSVLAVLAIYQLQDRFTQKLLIGVCILVAVISIVYRGLANAKFVHVLLGWQTKQEFLNKYLNRDFGHNYFYLSDDELKKLYD